MDWSIQELGAAGEFVGAIGVVITLVYLAYQIRQNTIPLEQNTLTARAAAQNASNTALRETRASIFESEDMAEIFSLGNSSRTLADGGVPVIGVRAVAASRATFGAYREVRAGGGSVTLETYGSERVLEAVAGNGGAPSADLGHVVVLITEASDPSVGVSGAVINASSASTTFYDSDLIPGQLTPSVAGTGRRGFALVLNVPAGDDANGSTVTLRVQLTSGTPTPSSMAVRVFPNTISWTSVRVAR